MNLLSSLKELGKFSLDKDYPIYYQDKNLESGVVTDKKLMEKNLETEEDTNTEAPDLNNNKLECSNITAHPDKDLKVLFNENKNINDKIVALEGYMRELINRFDRLEKEKYLRKVKIVSDKFINMYAKSGKGAAVNVNDEIKHEVLKYMANKYDIKKNVSKAIDTTLLIALYGKGESRD